MGWVIFQENKKKQKRNNEGVENHSTSILSTKVKKKKSQRNIHKKPK